MEEKKEENSSSQPTAIAWSDHADNNGLVDVEKEMAKEEQQRQHSGNIDTPSSGDTLNASSSDEAEEKDLISALPTIGNGNEGSRPSTRPQLESRGTTELSTVRSLPRLKRKETKMMQKEAHPMQHLGITLGLPAILIFDIIVPCIIYYTWYNSHKHGWERECREQYHVEPRDCPVPKPEFDENILGYAIVSFGVGELWILIARVHRLFWHREDCAPLLSRNRWELDATSWVYGVSMIMALIPFVVGSSLVLPHLYLYSPSFLMGFLGLLMVVTTFCPFTIPIGINSQPRGTKLRPFIYYAAEDFIAVDGLQDREFRERFNDRYENNQAFRRLFLYLTIWWTFGVATYVGCVSAVIWTLDFHFAFGLSLGVLFAYIAIWAAVSYVWVRVEIEREHRAFEDGKFDP